MLLSLLTGLGLAETARPPNLVLLVADDLGLMDLSTYGGSQPTPNIDALAARGVTMEAAYVVSPICAPSRAGILTGRYPQRYGAELITHTVYPRDPFSRAFARLFVAGDGWEIAPRQRPPSRAEVEVQGLPTSEITLAELMKSSGYHTAMAGKWHVGVSEAQRPAARGFERSYGFLEAYSLYQNPASPDVLNHRLDHFADRHQWRHGREGPTAILRDGQVIDEPRYLTDVIADELIADIQVYKDGPFFLYGAFNAPHTPYQAPLDAVDPAQTDPGRQVYEAMVRRLDQAIGKVVAALDAAGLADNTLIVVTSDNGAASYTHVASNLPYNGGKFTHLEGGVRVPMVVVWPGHLPEGARYAPPVSTLDLFTTFAAAAGATLPQDRAYDGVDLAPLLRGEAEGAPHEALYWAAGGSKAIRVGDYKLLVDELTGDRALFDLRRDPYENMDLASAEPDRVKSMLDLLNTWRSGLPPAAWPPVMQYRYNQGGRSWVFPL